MRFGWLYYYFNRHLGEWALELHGNPGLKKALVLSWGTFDRYAPVMWPISEELGGAEKLRRVVDRVKGYGWLYSAYHSFVSILDHDPQVNLDLTARDDQGRPDYRFRWNAVDEDRWVEMAKATIPKERAAIAPNADITDILTQASTGRLHMSEMGRPSITVAVLFHQPGKHGYPARFAFKKTLACDIDLAQARAGEQAAIPGIEYTLDKKEFSSRHYLAIREHYRAPPNGPYSYSQWDSAIPRLEARPTHARWLRQYLPMVEEGTWAWLELGESSLRAATLPDNVVASAFANRELYLVLANYNNTSVEASDNLLSGPFQNYVSGSICSLGATAGWSSSVGQVQHCWTSQQWHPASDNLLS